MKMEQFGANEYEAPKVSDNELGVITEVKANVQEKLMENMLGHCPTDDEALVWIETYAKYLNFYFVEHHDATMDNITEIEKYLLEKTAPVLH